MSGTWGHGLPTRLRWGKLLPHRVLRKQLWLQKLPWLLLLQKLLLLVLRLRLRRLPGRRNPPLRLLHWRLLLRL